GEGKAMFGFIEDAWHSAMHFVADHWKTIAVVAASTLAFVAVTALTGGLGAPFMAAMLAGGFASGVTGYAVSNWLDHKPIPLTGALTAGAVSAVVTVATVGVGRFASPLLSRIAVPAVDDVVSSTAGQAAVKVVTNAATGAAFGASTQVAT